ncbi:MAG TPA: hypothetical protein VIQ81_03955 [Gammaproteobacteria bacterium]
MISLIIAILAFLLGLLCFPLVMFLRARRSSAWDNSNMTNIYRVLAHLSTRPGDFARMQYSNGQKPFWYLSKDELSEVVKTKHP